MISSGYDLFAVLVHRHGGMIVKTLRHKLKGQRIFLSARLLYFRPLVLEPNLDLRLIQVQVPRELLPSSLCQISILCEFPLQSGQLFGAKGRSGPLLFLRAALAVLRTFDSPRARSWKRQKKARINLHATFVTEIGGSEGITVGVLINLSTHRRDSAFSRRRDRAR